jgi:hypothetical protein
MVKPDLARTGIDCSDRKPFLRTMSISIPVASLMMMFSWILCDCNKAMDLILTIPRTGIPVCTCALAGWRPVSRSVFLSYTVLHNPVCRPVFLSYTVLHNPVSCPALLSYTVLHNPVSCPVFLSYTVLHNPVVLATLVLDLFLVHPSLHTACPPLLGEGRHESATKRLGRKHQSACGAPLGMTTMATALPGSGRGEESLTVRASTGWPHDECSQPALPGHLRLVSRAPTEPRSLLVFV